LRHLKVAPSADVGDKFGALSAFAETGRDRKQALEFSIQEKRAQRFWRDKPLGSIAGITGFWFGVLHEAGSNYGRSFGRPFALWILSVFAFASYYLTRSDVKLVSSNPDSALPEWLGEFPKFVQSMIGKLHGLTSGLPELVCATGGSGAWHQALGFSLQTALFQPLRSGELMATDVLQCLFGVGTTGLHGAAAAPVDVIIMAAAQEGLSLLLMGFFLHALWLRIKN